MTKADGTTYDTDYSNVEYKSSTVSGNQTWTATTPILLTGTKANVYAYYPYDRTYTNITAIPINVTENKDVMWATPATNIYNASPTATLPMNHALSVIRFSLSKGDYSGAGSIESISIQGDCMAKSGTLNVKTGDVIISDAGAEIDFGTLGAAATLSTTATTVEQLVIPTTTSGSIKVTIKMDGKTFEATSSATVSTEKSKAYKFGLAFSDSKLTMSTVSIGTIAETEVGNMHPIISTQKEDGVYAIKSDKTLVPYADASDASYEGVAIIMYGRTMQVSNSELTGKIWGSTSTNISDIEDVIDCGGGVSGTEGYIPKSDGSYDSGSTSDNQIPQDHTAWLHYSNTALTDTAGWSHTDAMIKEQTESNYLGPQIKEFRAGTSNQGYKDWFVPAAGQLTYIFVNFDKINNLLGKCGATKLTKQNYWSSSEYSSTNAWYVFVGYRLSVNYNKSYYDGHVRFLRDFTE